MADQRVVTGTLADIAERVQEAGVGAPAITIVGPVAGLRDELAWRERRPLAGRRIVVTRARPQASGLAATLTDLGAIVTQAPAIAIHPVDVELPDLTGYDLVCLTSVNGVDRLFELVRDARSLAGPTIAAIGPGDRRATPRARRRRGRGPDPRGRRGAAGGGRRPRRAARDRPARPRGPRRPARRAARARRRGRRRDALRDPARAAGRGDARRRPGRGLDHVHRGLGGACRS